MGSQVTADSKPACILAIVATLFAVAIFLGNFILGLDPGSGARTDLYTFHMPAIYGFRAHPWIAEVQNYPSATTPLFQLIMSISPFLGNDTAFRSSTVFFAFVIYVLYTIALRVRFRDSVEGRPWALLIGASLLLSPYFEGTAYWANTDTLPLFLAIAAFLFIMPIQDCTRNWTHTLPAPLIAVSLAILSWGAFYARQSYVFLPLYLFVLLLIRLPASRGWTLGAFGVAGLPGLALFICWRGLTPPPFQQMHQGFSLGILVYPLTMIAVYALPFLFSALLDPAERRHALRVSHTGVLITALGAVFFLMIFHGFSFTHGAGGGIATKVFARCGRAGPALFLLLAYAGLIILINIYRSASWPSQMLMVLFLLPTLMMKVIYERYYDPLIYVLFFLFFDRNAVRKFVHFRAGLAVLVFGAALLGGTCMYHTKDNPVFPIYGSSRPWAGMQPTGDTGLPYN